MIQSHLRGQFQEREGEEEESLKNPSVVPAPKLEGGNIKLDEKREGREDGGGAEAWVCGEEGQTARTMRPRTKKDVGGLERRRGREEACGRRRTGKR